MSKLSIKGILIGGIVDLVATFLLGLPIIFYARSRVDLSHLSNAQADAAVMAALHADLPLYVGQLFVSLMCAVLGGYIAASIAKRSEELNGILSSSPCILLAIVLMIAGKESDPPWIQTIMFIAVPASALLGGHLRARQVRARAQYA